MSGFTILQPNRHEFVSATPFRWTHATIERSESKGAPPTALRISRENPSGHGVHEPTWRTLAREALGVPLRS
jgi:hypothetical protein